MTLNGRVSSNGGTMTIPKSFAVTRAVNGHKLGRTMQVYLNENVFIGMVLSSVEVYKKECFGLLLGYRTPEKYIVEHAIPYQTVRRGHNWAELRSDKWKVLQETLKNFPRMDILGDFHSHTMYRDIKAQVSLSRDDIEYMEPDDLQMVIAVNENKRSREWSINSDRTLSGSIDKLYFKIAAYYFPYPWRTQSVSLPELPIEARRQGKAGGPQNGDRGKLGRPKLADILCPYVAGYNNK